MSSTNPSYDKITFDEEDDEAEVADRLLESIRDSLIDEATGDKTDEILGPAAAAIEVHSRITYTDEFPAHTDPRDEIDGIESITDDIIRKYTDDLVRSAQQMDEDDRKQILDVVAEIDAREGGAN